MRARSIAGDSIIKVKGSVIRITGEFSHLQNGESIFDCIGETTAKSGANENVSLEDLSFARNVSHPREYNAFIRETVCLLARNRKVIR